MGAYSVWVGRMTTNITKKGKRKGLVGVVYQHCTRVGTDRKWEDAVVPKKKILMRDDIPFDNVLGRIFWGYRADDQLLMPEQVWTDLAERLPSHYEEDSEDE